MEISAGAECAAVRVMSEESLLLLQHSRINGCGVTKCVFRMDVYVCESVDVCMCFSICI